MNAVYGLTQLVLSQSEAHHMAMDWTALLLRWFHLVAGILWIGHLYFFNFVNAQVAKTYDADSKKKVVPELMPRALYWFRIGAALTWITGFLLAGMVYYMGGAMMRDGGLSNGAAIGFGVASLIIGFGIYDLLWSKTPLAKNETAAAAVSYALIAIWIVVAWQFISGRAVFIHVGAIFGTIMAANVWMRIWPNQRKIIAGIKGTGPAADPSLVAVAGLRSKHNVYMSIPLMFTMISNHYPTVYGHDLGYLSLIVIIGLSFGMTKAMYKRSADPSTAAF